MQFWYSRPHSVLFVSCLLLVVCGFAMPGQAAKLELANQALRVQATSSGTYEVTDISNGWRFAGSLGERAQQIGSRGGADRIGPFHEIRLVYGQGSREGIIRLYDRRPLIEFRLRMLRAGKNEGAFPAFQSLPAGVFRLGFQPIAFGFYEFGKLGSQGPWVLFDGKGNTVTLSPADHFFVSDMRDGAEGASSGILDSVGVLPAGFSHTTLFVAGRGVSETLGAWGNAMREIGGSTPPSNTADVLLRKLSYWTDHGAYYFYNYDPKLGYPGTLFAVKQKFEELGLPLGSMQIDSWFYPKGETADWHKRPWTNGVGGEYLYRAAKEVFPDGLGAFQRKLDLPLITHARWIDRASPYRKTYKTSGNVIVDPRFWQKTAAWLHASGVVVYEQDWMARYAKAEPNLTDPQAFHDEMAQAMERYGLTMQYCMAAPADFMQGSQYGNLTTIRTSHDRFLRKDWDSFLYDSRVASALGIWPWTDVFLSGEEGNLLMATLSAGPVGVGDAVNEIDVQDLLRAVRGDGVIVKPDQTLRPLDRMYLADARGDTTPMVAATETGFGPLHIDYLFAYPRKDAQSVEVKPSELGFAGAVYAYDWRAGAGRRMDAGDALAVPFTDGWGYEVISPVGRSGMAFIGDTGNFVTAGKSRIRLYSDDGILRFTVAFAPNEKARTIAVYAPEQPDARVLDGSSKQERFDSQAHLFLLTLQPGADRLARVALQRPKLSANQ